MLYETGRALRYLLDAPAGSVGEKLTTAIREGLEIAGSRYLDERAEIDAMRTAFFTTLKADVFLWPAAPTTAPEGLAWTGEPKYIAPWTALGGPVVTMRAGLASNGLPAGRHRRKPPGQRRRDVRMGTAVGGGDRELARRLGSGWPQVSRGWCRHPPMRPQHMTAVRPDRRRRRRRAPCHAGGLSHPG